MEISPVGNEGWRHLLASRAARHVVDAAVPVTAFLVGYDGGGPAAGITLALVVAGLLAAVRLRRGDSLRMVLFSLTMVGVHSLIVVAGGQGRDFFSTELVGHTVFTTVFAFSLLVGKPFSGMVAHKVGLESPAWRFDPPRLRKHQRMTALLLAVWLLHLAAMVPFYLDNDVTALGAVSTVVVKPTAVAVVILCWRWMRRPVNEPEAPEPQALLAGSSGTPAGS